MGFGEDKQHQLTRRVLPAFGPLFSPLVRTACPGEGTVSRGPVFSISVRDGRVSVSPKARLALHHGQPGARRIARLAEYVAVGREMPDLAVRDAVPECAGPIEPAVSRVARNDRRITVMAPIETPDTQSGSISASCSAW